MKNKNFKEKKTLTVKVLIKTPPLKRFSQIFKALHESSLKLGKAEVRTVQASKRFFEEG